MGRGRVACWKADSEEQTIPTLAARLEPWIGSVVISSSELYSTTNFGGKTDEALLTKHKNLLDQLRGLDPRGAYYAHEDVVGGLGICIDANDLEATALDFAQQEGISLTEYIDTLSMKLRVMCCHYRIQVKPIAQKRARKQPNPFVAFRGDAAQASSSEEEIETEKAKVVTRYFDGKRAVEIWSDGSIAPATEYLEGEDGFVIAGWSTTGANLELELANSALLEGGLLGPPAPRMKRITKKKPAASAKAVLKKPSHADHGESEGAGGDVDDEDSDVLIDEKRQQPDESEHVDAIETEGSSSTSLVIAKKPQEKSL